MQHPCQTKKFEVAQHMLFDGQDAAGTRPKVIKKTYLSAKDSGLQGPRMGLSEVEYSRLIQQI